MLYYIQRLKMDIILPIRVMAEVIQHRYLYCQQRIQQHRVFLLNQDILLNIGL